MGIEYYPLPNIVELRVAAAGFEESVIERRHRAPRKPEDIIVAVYCYKIQRSEDDAIQVVYELSTLERIHRLGGKPLLLMAKLVDEAEVDESGQWRPGA